MTTTGGSLERFSLESLTLSEARIDALRGHFPEAFSERGFDLETLARSLGEWKAPESERFGLHWPGKAECARVIQEPSIGTLTPLRAESKNWDNSENLVIEGDNLEVLKLLQRSYHGKVKLIYIDPPYNTGKEFIYPDKFKEGLEEYLRYSGQVDGNGLKVTANSETDGRYHSKWLSMMYPRLFLARNLLRDDGVIFVSIDDHEVHNLRAIMNEVFGEENFAAQIVVVSNLKGRNDRKNVATAHDYLLMYTRHSFKSRGLLLTKEQRSEYRHTDDEGRAFRWGDLRKRGGADTRTERPNLYFPVWVNPQSGSVSMERSPAYTLEVFPLKADGAEGCWRWGRERVASAVAELRATRVNADRWNVRCREYLETDGVLRTSTPKSVWTGSEFSTDSATKALRQLLPGVEGLTPKPVGLLSRIIELTMEDGDICLDFFAGSGTTGHAVLEACGAFALSLRFILVQLPEPVEDDRFETVASITRARVAAAGAKIAMNRNLGETELDLGFRAFRLEPSNFRVWDGGDTTEGGAQFLFADSLTDEATADAVVAELLLKAGFDLVERVEVKEVGGLVVHSVSEDQLLIVPEGLVTLDAIEAMVAMKPALILVLDRCFGDDDELKVNTMQTVRAANQGAGTNITLKVV